MKDELKIRRAAVLGAGVMGAQIAAHLAAAGIRTYLLDLESTEPPKDPAQAKLVGKAFASSRAILAIENLKQLKPAPLYSAKVLASIIPGNFDDDLSVIADCDWVIEAVIERMDIKKDLHRRIAEYAKPHIPVTTNTSGLSLAEIVRDLPEDYQKLFFGTHFFNPPRYMRLMEIIPHPVTDRRLMEKLARWIEERLGKGTVEARDTVNFIANRIGVFATQAALRHMAELKLNVETVDNLTGPLMGRAKSATLRTMDVVGLDTFMAVAKNTHKSAPKDPYREWFLGPQWIEELISKGALGQKTGSVGCYKKDKDAKGSTVILAYRPESKSYVPQAPTVYPWEEEASKERDTVKRLKFILQQKDDGAIFVWRAVRDVISYAACLVEEIANGLVKPIDEALKWGFNWEFGPFELWQALGYDEILQRLKQDGAPMPNWAKPGMKLYDPAPGTPEWLANYGAERQLDVRAGRQVKVQRPEWAYHLPPFESKDDKRLVMSNKSASLVDIGDGVAALVFHSKMNALDADIMGLMAESVNACSTHFDAMVVGNDAPHFSAGANLKMILGAIQGGRFDNIELFIREFQGALQLLKFAPFPTVSCPHGLVLGGGCEVALHTTVRVAAAETYAGLVEVGVGLIPAGGGTKELALRAYDAVKTSEKGDPSAFLQRAFLLIGMGTTSQSAHEAVEMGLLPATTEISLSKDHLIHRAKRRALALVRDGYQPKSPVTGIKVLGDPGIQTFRMMLYNMVEGRQISKYDAFIAERVARVLCGGEVDAGTQVNEQYFLDLERQAFVELCRQKSTAERIEHMLKTGKPLRN